VTFYSDAERAGVAILAVAALISILAVAALLAFKPPKRKRYKNTHIYGYLMSLLCANVIQAAGTLLNFEWVAQGGIIAGAFCATQGGVKQFGNVATAFWSCMISIHLFNLLFMRMGTTKYAFWGTFAAGWGLVFLVVILGPTAIERHDNGPYFGPSGAWCWITRNYGVEQIFLEYFLEYFAAITSLILYTAILLRVRGNLIITGGSWRFRTVPPGESWKLCFSRDLLDTAMLSVAKMMVWYPVAYTALLIPITITRISEFSGASIPFGATVVADSIYNLTGLVNVILFLCLQRLFPELQGLPQFNTKRINHLGLQSAGIDPFPPGQNVTAEQYRRGQELYIPKPERAHFPSFMARKHSQDSDDESWGNKGSDCGSSDYGSDFGYYTDDLPYHQIPYKPPEPPQKPVGNKF